MRPESRNLSQEYGSGFRSSPKGDNGSQLTALRVRGIRASGLESRRQIGKTLRGAGKADKSRSDKLQGILSLLRLRALEPGPGSNPRVVWATRTLVAPPVPEPYYQGKQIPLGTLITGTKRRTALCLAPRSSQGGTLINSGRLKAC